MQNFEISMEICARAVDSLEMAARSHGTAAVARSRRHCGPLAAARPREKLTTQAGLRGEIKILKKYFLKHRFSAFWLRSKCSICSYQLNI